MIDFWPKAIFSQRFLAFRLPQKIPFPKTVICYLLFVTQKIRFQKLSTVNCNAWCELALSKKQEQSSRNLFFLSENCNTVSCKN